MRKTILCASSAPTLRVSIIARKSSRAERHFPTLVHREIIERNALDKTRLSVAPPFQPRASRRPYATTYEQELTNQAEVRRDAILARAETLMVGPSSKSSEELRNEEKNAYSSHSSLSSGGVTRMIPYNE